MDREAWCAAIHEITKSRTQLRDWTELNLSLLQGIFPTQESNQGLLHCRWIPYQLSYQENLFKQYLTALFFLNPFNVLPMPLLDALICCLFPAVFTSIICLFTWALPVQMKLGFLATAITTLRAFLIYLLLPLPIPSVYSDFTSSISESEILSMIHAGYSLAFCTFLFITLSHNFYDLLVFCLSMWSVSSKNCVYTISVC